METRAVMRSCMHHMLMSALYRSLMEPSKSQFWEDAVRLSCILTLSIDPMETITHMEASVEFTGTHAEYSLSMYLKENVQRFQVRYA